jgi:hypothetical protein
MQQRNTRFAKSKQPLPTASSSSSQNEEKEEECKSLFK